MQLGTTTRLSFSLFPAEARHGVGARRHLHYNIPALHRAGRLHQQSTMSLSGASGSAAGYANLIVKIAIFVVSLNSMINMCYLRNFTYHTLLFSTRFIFMITLMVYPFDKRIYDIMFFLLTSILWIKSNMNLPKFLTICCVHSSFFLFCDQSCLLMLEGRWLFYLF